MCSSHSISPLFLSFHPNKTSSFSCHLSPSIEFVLTSFHEPPSFLMEEENSACEFNSISTKSLSSHPLFSTLVTFYALVLLYFPSLFRGILFSPILILTGILLLTLLRLGAIQKTQKEFDPKPEDPKWVSPESNSETENKMGLDPNPVYTESFVEWNVRAPLEVIYEESEGEEEEERNGGVLIERYASLSMYYPESDSDGSSDGDFAGIGDWNSPENLCFRWDEENREELIEIALDGKRRSEEVFHFDEEGLIEIDISPARIRGESISSPSRNGEPCPGDCSLLPAEPFRVKL